MDFPSVFFVSAFYAGTAAFIAGFLYKIWIYAVTPAPLPIARTPAPVTLTGAFGRVAVNVLFFQNLFRGNKWTWLGGYIFHLALLFVLIRHLRYFLEPVTPMVAALQPLGVIAGAALPVAAGYLYILRMMVDRTRFITAFSDVFALALIGLIGVTGILMKFVYRTDVVGVKNFIIGLIKFRPEPVPHDGILFVHLGLVIVLMIYFPWSKLMHSGGIFFSPTLNQADNAREKRHVNPWADAR